MTCEVVSAVVGAVLFLAAPIAADRLETRMLDLLAGFQEEYGFPGATASIGKSFVEMTVLAQEWALADLAIGYGDGG